MKDIVLKSSGYVLFTLGVVWLIVLVVFFLVTTLGVTGIFKILSLLVPFVLVTIGIALIIKYNPTYIEDE